MTITPPLLPPGSRWRVLAFAGRDQHRRLCWQVECVCGKRAVRAGRELRSGKSLSCGCLRGEQVARRNRQGALPRWGPHPPRVCAHCGREYECRSKRSRFCGDICRGRATWQRIAADPARKQAHSDRVTADHRAVTHVPHACAQCGQPFVAAPGRKFCSCACLETVIATGQYRHAFQRRRAERELAEIQAELEKRHGKEE